MEQNDLDVEVRFDIIAITKTKEGLILNIWRMRFITFNGVLLQLLLVTNSGLR